MDPCEITFNRFCVSFAKMNQTTVADPSKLYPVDLVGKMIFSADHVQTNFVRNDTKIADSKAKDKKIVGDPSLLILAILSVPIDCQSWCCSTAAQEDSTVEMLTAALLDFGLPLFALMPGF